MGRQKLLPPTPPVPGLARAWVSPKHDAAPDQPGRALGDDMRGLLWGVLATAGLSAVAQADVITSQPYLGTSDWTTGAYDVANVGSNPDGSVTFETAPYRGIWFGYGQSYGYYDSFGNYRPNYPGWSPGSDSVGNHLTLQASFGGSNIYGANADWDSYLLDGQYEASMLFNPTDCGCYGQAGASGVSLLFGDGPGGYRTQFVALDTSVMHTYEYLLRDGLVSYRIDGRAYSGAAYAVGYWSPLLVIGDGSGSTGTGVGTMTIHSVRFDTAPEEHVLLGLVPEPASWATMLLGFGAIGAGLRARRRGLTPA
jgi:hypothetical protein